MGVNRLVDMLVKTLAEVQSDRLGNVAAEKLVDSMADTQDEVEDEIAGHKMGDVEAKALLDTLADTVKIVESETPRERLGDKALVDTLFYQGYHETKTRGNTLDNLDAEALVDTLDDTLATSGRDS